MVAGWWLRMGRFHASRSGNRIDGLNISFADGHAIFWNYVEPKTMPAPINSTSEPDWAQYLAWFEGQAPRGVLP